MSKKLSELNKVAVASTGSNFVIVDGTDHFGKQLSIDDLLRIYAQTISLNDSSNRYLVDASHNIKLTGVVTSITINNSLNQNTADVHGNVVLQQVIQAVSLDGVQLYPEEEGTLLLPLDNYTKQITINDRSPINATASNITITGIMTSIKYNGVVMSPDSSGMITINAATAEYVDAALATAKTYTDDSFATISDRLTATEELAENANAMASSAQADMIGVSTNLTEHIAKVADSTTTGHIKIGSSLNIDSAGVVDTKLLTVNNYQPDATGNILLTAEDVGALAESADAESAKKWSTARTLTLSGDATGAVIIDGTADIDLVVSVVGGTGGGIPIGMVVQRPVNDVPAGWLKCDGTIFDTEIFPDLYATLGSDELPYYSVFPDSDTIWCIKASMDQVARQARMLTTSRNSPEYLAEQARIKRDGLLSETDYLLMSDYNIDAALRTQIIVYRQALRDITAQPGFPQIINWPMRPQVQEV